MKKFLLVLLAALALVFSQVPQTAASLTTTQNQNSSRKGNPNAKVWVNTSSSVYHCPGTRWYGATKRGEYMTQKAAQEGGNRPAYGKYCE